MLPKEDQDKKSPQLKKETICLSKTFAEEKYRVSQVEEGLRMKIFGEEAIQNWPR